MENEIETGIYNALLANSDITDITSEIYPDLAPASARDPYIIITLNAGSVLNDNPALDTTINNFLVKAVSTNPNSANSLANAIRATLHEASLSLSTWTNYRTQAITPVRMVETIERVQYWHRGHIFRIRSNN